MSWVHQILWLLVLVSVSLNIDAKSVIFKTDIKRTELLSSETAGDRYNEKEYYFVANGKKKPYAFLNDVGVLVGFDVDLVNEVCQTAGKKCHFILAEVEECIFTDRNIAYAGRGIQSKWFDACTSYAVTTDRKNNFDFTLPYLETSCSFTVKTGNPSKFDPDASDYSKFTILHLNGAPSNAQCLTRLDKKFNNIIVAKDLPEAKALLENGTADVLFSPRHVIEGLEVLPARVQCSQVGAGMMVRKGSNLPDWWNPAFQEIYFSGRFEKLCADATDKYGSSPSCLPSPKLASEEILSVMREAPVKSKLEREEKLWTFVVSGRVAPYSYLNHEGELVGFTKDMLMEVCRRANKRCSLMTAEVSECTTNSRDGQLLYPGRGMSEGWFDGCTGYFNTFDRSNSWDFTTPYLVSTSSFKVAPGNPSNFNTSAEDYSPWTIVHSETAITNAHCLNRLHKKFGKLLVAKDEVESQKLVLEGKADAWFTKFREEERIHLESLPEKFHCGHVGTSIMVKKGSEVPRWWNPAFSQWYRSGGFNQFCMDQEKLHPGVSFPCLPSPTLQRPDEGF